MAHRGSYVGRFVHLSWRERESEREREREITRPSEREIGIEMKIDRIGIIR